MAIDNNSQPGGVTQRYGPTGKPAGAGEFKTFGDSKEIAVDLNDLMDPAGNAESRTLTLTPNAFIVDAFYSPDMGDAPSGSVVVARAGVGLTDTAAVTTDPVGITLLNTRGAPSVVPGTADTVTISMSAYTGSATAKGKLVIRYRTSVSTSTAP